jgi:hypothetical protein
MAWIERSDHRLDVPHVFGQALGFLPVGLDAPADVGMEVDQKGNRVLGVYF